MSEIALLAAAATLADAVPESVIRDIAAQIELQAAGCTPKACAAIASGVAQARYRAAVQVFLQAWQIGAPAVPSVGVAWALRAAARTVAEERARQSIELVWTGPNPEGTPLRRTDGALLEVINTARRMLTIVTFAAYKVPAVAAALVAAAQRGVEIRLVIESAQASEGKVAYEGLAALGPDVRERARVYIWPLDRRETDEAGRHGSLHVKCAVADDSLLFVSSANLTQYALTLNMELGLLVRGGPMPGRVGAHIDQLIRSGDLVPLALTGGT